MPAIEIVTADLTCPDHQAAVLTLIDAYARDPLGNGQPLSAEVRKNLIPGLRRHPTTLIFLAWQGEQPVGIAVCFYGFSTFAARPLINIHDFAVLPECRGNGIGRKLLAAVEAQGRRTACCKITLEVLENNHRARRIYATAGFEQLTYVEGSGGALFLAKAL
ncbi:MAG: GNAT family N-acetyltransferase [Desulfobacterales bacterium]